MSTKFFAIDPQGQLLSSHDDCASADQACNDDATKNHTDPYLYSVDKEGENEIIEISPNLGLSLSEDDYQTELDKLEKCYTECEKGTRYSVSVRTAHRGETAGTYWKRPDGSLQILGYSIDRPDDLSILQQKAFELFCK